MAGLGGGMVFPNLFLKKIHSSEVHKGKIFMVHYSFFEKHFITSPINFSFFLRQASAQTKNKVIKVIIRVAFPAQEMEKLETSGLIYKLLCHDDVYLIQCSDQQLKRCLRSS